jgi:hypothetical protein
MFNSVIEDDTEIITNIQPSDVNEVPLDLGNGIKIRSCSDFYPQLNSKIQMYNGPFWTFNDNVGLASYVAVDKPLDLVRQELKAIVANERWVEEQAGTKAIIQSQEVTVDTARGIRDIFIQQFLLLPENATSQWKFPEGWMNVTKSDLGICVGAGVAHVQSAFNWEAMLVSQIDSSTLQELNDLVIIENNSNGGM